MGFVLRSVTIDCADPFDLARWWCEVFGVSPSPDDFPGDPEASCDLGPGRPRLLFERVPEPKFVKNRVHLDLHAGDRREDEVERLTQIGARFLEDHRREDGGGWVVLADPEGNEFCIEGKPALD